MARAPMRALLLLWVFALARGLVPTPPSSRESARGAAPRAVEPSPPFSNAPAARALDAALAERAADAAAAALGFAGVAAALPVPPLYLAAVGCAYAARRAGRHDLATFEVLRRHFDSDGWAGARAQFGVAVGAWALFLALYPPVELALSLASCRREINARASARNSTSPPRSRLDARAAQLLLLLLPEGARRRAHLRALRAGRRARRRRARLGARLERRSLASLGVALRI